MPSAIFWSNFNVKRECECAHFQLMPVVLAVGMSVGWLVDRYRWVVVRRILTEKRPVRYRRNGNTAFVYILLWTEHHCCHIATVAPAPNADTCLIEKWKMDQQVSVLLFIGWWWQQQTDPIVRHTIAMSQQREDACEKWMRGKRNKNQLLLSFSL